MNILIVEDNVSLSKLMRTFLQREGHEVIEKTRLDDALCQINEGGEFDLVVLDVNLPDGSGLDIFDHPEVAKLATPILAISGGGQLPLEAAWAEATARGAAGFIYKPFSRADFLEAVKDAAAKG